MKDLTDGSIAKNILQMALPIAAGMFFQTLYFLIDLYFVAGLGDAALAGEHHAAGCLKSLAGAQRISPTLDRCRGNELSGWTAALLIRVACFEFNDDL